MRKSAKDVSAIALNAPMVLHVTCVGINSKLKASQRLVRNAKKINSTIKRQQSVLIV